MIIGKIILLPLSTIKGAEPSFLVLLCVHDGISGRICGRRSEAGRAKRKMDRNNLHFLLTPLLLNHAAMELFFLPSLHLPTCVRLCRGLHPPQGGERAEPDHRGEDPGWVQPVWVIQSSFGILYLFRAFAINNRVATHAEGGGSGAGIGGGVSFALKEATEFTSWRALNRSFQSLRKRRRRAVTEDEVYSKCHRSSTAFSW